jgi:GlpG protein
MRSIGQLPTEAQAALFRDYLQVRKIETRVESGATPEAWSVWIFDEDRVAEARTLLEEFRLDPHHERYAGSVRAARTQRDALLAEELAARKRTIDLRRHWDRPLHQAVPVTLIIIVMCGMTAAVTRFGDDREAMNEFHITKILPQGMYDPTLPEIQSGEVWRVFTPALLHLGVLHLLGNAYWAYLFGRILEPILGHWRYLLLILLIAAGSNLAQFWYVDPAFGGYSGVNAGLFGYIWLHSQLSPRSPYGLDPQTVLFFAGWMIICLTGAAGPIANTAHMSGLAIGMALAGARILIGRRT